MILACDCTHADLFTYKHTRPVNPLDARGAFIVLCISIGSIKKKLQIGTSCGYYDSKHSGQHNLVKKHVDC